MPVVVLDSGGLSALANFRRSGHLRALMQAADSKRLTIVVPSVVLAEALTGRARDATTNQVLKSTKIVPVDERTARTGAALRHRARTGSAVDAVVVATALGFDEAIVLTSDPDDVNALAAGRHHIVVQTV